MRIYDPSERIRYVHLAQEAAASAARPDAGDACRRLPAGYANRSAQTRLEEPPKARAGSATGAAGTAGARPALVVIPGGATEGTVAAPSEAATALRLA